MENVAVYVLGVDCFSSRIDETESKNCEENTYERMDEEKGFASVPVSVWK